MGEYNLKMDITTLKECIDYNTINRYNLMIECDYYYDYNEYSVKPKVLSGVLLKSIFTEALMRPDRFIEILDNYGINTMSRSEFYKHISKNVDKQDKLRILVDNLDYKAFSHFLDILLITVVYDDFVYRDKKSWI